jgi:hypothetical protein
MESEPIVVDGFREYKRAGGTEKLGREISGSQAGQVELHGGEGGYTFSSLVFTGKVNAEWAKSFLEGK